MNINQLSKIIKKKILDNKIINNVKIEDKTFLHVNHKSNDKGKFHISLKIESEELKNKNKIQSNKIIYKILEYEIKNYIHSIQILFI